MCFSSTGCSCSGSTRGEGGDVRGFFGRGAHEWAGEALLSEWAGAGAGTVEKGYAAEVAVADAIVTMSRGALMVARPKPDDHGVDRLVFRVGGGGALSLQVKAAFALGEYGIVEFAFDKHDVPTRHASFFGLCLAFVENPLGPPTKFWLVPPKEILRGGGRRGINKLRIPYRPKREGRWTPYEHPFSDLANALVRELDTAQARREARRGG